MNVRMAILITIKIVAWVFTNIVQDDRIVKIIFTTDKENTGYCENRENYINAKKLEENRIVINEEVDAVIGIIKKEIADAENAKRTQ